jgi:ferrochelatase
MAANCEYASQLHEAGGLIAEELKVNHWRLVYQSRSGSPLQPWLGPDITDYLRQINAEGVTSVVVAPIGFVSDHMEIVYDLDFEAQNLARELGMTMVRAATAGTHPSFVKMIRELIRERINNEPPRFLGSRGAVHDVCPADCCLLVR